MRRLVGFQTPSQWLRAVLAGLLLAFALNTVAHASHGHDLDAASNAHSIACAYCTTFGGLAGVPVSAQPVRMDLHVGVERPDFDTTALPRRRSTTAQPRAPPRS